MERLIFDTSINDVPKNTLMKLYAKVYDAIDTPDEVNKETYIDMCYEYFRNEQRKINRDYLLPGFIDVYEKYVRLSRNSKFVLSQYDNVCTLIYNSFVDVMCNTICYEILPLLIINVCFLNSDSIKHLLKIYSTHKWFNHNYVTDTLVENICYFYDDAMSISYFEYVVSVENNLHSQNINLIFVKTLVDKLLIVDHINVFDDSLINIKYIISYECNILLKMLYFATNNNANRNKQFKNILQTYFIKELKKTYSIFKIYSNINTFIGRILTLIEQRNYVLSVVNDVYYSDLFILSHMLTECNLTGYKFIKHVNEYIHNKLTKMKSSCDISNIINIVINYSPDSVEMFYNIYAQYLTKRIFECDVTCELECIHNVKHSCKELTYVIDILNNHTRFDYDDTLTIMIMRYHSALSAHKYIPHQIFSNISNTFSEHYTKQYDKTLLWTYYSDTVELTKDSVSTICTNVAYASILLIFNELREISVDNICEKISLKNVHKYIHALVKKGILVNDDGIIRVSDDNSTCEINMLDHDVIVVNTDLLRCKLAQYAKGERRFTFTRVCKYVIDDLSICTSTAKIKNVICDLVKHEVLTKNNDTYYYNC
jgi:hypothetical protein